ncbi:alpha/beta fold hydrolase [Curtobacterium sp. ISL-83]|uniref:alpha/beta fold hydrolase n=1 Tax=Curtobacterium sp. ISL-83 TaxID=2819145 RepID=UPI001BEB3AEC|nr:alpha/beta fold hydrolase [Curtobacterium sp. ISL-83]MBT2501540.1 alpha/beta fold hydrolase [Curtobacterium sp. ISL-83]
MRALVETIRIDGLPVRLRTLAPAGRVRDTLAPTVVLVHGIGMSHLSFTRTQRALARTHRTITVDLPGFGGLPAAGRRLSVEELARVVVGALRAKGIVDCVLVGQSMGTQVVTEAALRQPDLVAAVVLIGPVTNDRRPTLVQQAVDLMRDMVVEGPRMNAIVLFDYARSFRQYVHELRPMVRYPTRQAVARLQVPVLVVRGTLDPIARPDWARRLVAAAARGALVELPGAHHVQEHSPVAFAEVVDEFRRVETLERLQ